MIEISDSDTYRFGAITYGTTSDATLTLTNTGDAVASSLSGNLSNANFQFKGGAFPGTGGTCSSSLGMRESCTVVVQFNPQAVSDNVEGALNITYYPSESGGTIENTRNLQGSSLSVASLSISDSPTYNFGRVVINQASDKTFTITNSGQSTASLVSPTLSSPFSLPGGGTCGTTLAGNATCTLVVRYTPTDYATHNDTLTISYNNGATSTSATASVTGLGVGRSGTIDTTFGTYGFKMPAVGFTLDAVTDGFMETSGSARYYAVGTSNNGNSTRYVLVRWRSTGALNTSFNTTGIVYLPINATSIAVDSGGVVYVGGPTSGSDTFLAVARYRTDGTLDTPFGTNGIARNITTCASGILENFLHAQTDGKIVYAAQGNSGASPLSLGRITTSGQTDATFTGIQCGQCNRLECSWGGLKTATWDGSEKVVAAYNDPGNASDPTSNIFRMNSDGTFDTTFSTDGFISGPGSGVQGFSTIKGIALDSSKNIYFSIDVDGEAPDTTNVAVAKYTTSGALTWLGTDGLGVGAFQPGALSIVASNNAVYIAGASSTTSATNFVVLTPTGTLDTTFASTGILRTSLIQNTRRMFAHAGGETSSIGGIYNFGIAKLKDPAGPFRSGEAPSLFFDTTFQSTGILSQNIGTDTNAMLTSLILDSTGRLYALGEAYVDTTGYYHPFILRYDTLGVLDTSFNTDGIADTTFHASKATLGTTAKNLAIRSDGKIVIAYRDGLALFRTNGVLEPGASGFGTWGVLSGITPNYVSTGSSGSLFYTSDTGTNTFVARYRSNGVIETTFVGTVGSGDSRGYSLIVQGGDFPLVTGSATSATNVLGFSLARFTTGGPIDATFGTSGFMISTFTPGSASDKSVTVFLSTNGIYSAGIGGGGFSIARYLTGGGIDTTFNSTGKVRHSITGITLTARDSILMTDGGALVTGGSATASWTVLRIRSDGSLESGFGTSGFFRAAFGTGADISTSLAMQTDGKFIIGGFTSTASPTTKKATFIRLWP